jgi:hypothetical protein
MLDKHDCVQLLSQTVLEAEMKGIYKYRPKPPIDFLHILDRSICGRLIETSLFF